MSPCQIVPKLADKSQYVASESSFYRVLHENDMLKHRGASKPRTHKKPDEHIAKSPNEVWSWDITYLRSIIKGHFFFLYLILDIFSRKIVGFEVHDEQCSDLASNLIEAACYDENIEPNERPVLHADNGTPMKGSSMLATMQMLGVTPSFSRPSVSNDNPYSESIFKTLKYCPVYPSKPFSSVEAAREWVKDFVEWYNNIHLHSGIKFVTPAQRHTGLDKQILPKRDKVYKEARQRNPQRWSRGTRNWNPIGQVYLNPQNSGTQAA